MRDEELYAELDDFVVGEEPADDELEGMPPPEDAAGANRLLRRVRALEAEVEQVDRVTGSEIQRLKDFASDRTAGLRRRMKFYELALEGWTRKRHDETRGKVQTTKLPGGELRVRASQNRLVVFDEEAAVANIEAERPSWVRTTQAVAKDEVKGAVVPGPVTLTPYGPKGEPLVVVPPGYELREAWEFAAVDFGLFRLPIGRRVPHLALLCPTQPSFSYKTHRREPGQ